MYFRAAGFSNIPNSRPERIRGALSIPRILGFRGSRSRNYTFASDRSIDLAISRAEKASVFHKDTLRVSSIFRVSIREERNGRRHSTFRTVLRHLNFSSDLRIPPKNSQMFRSHSSHLISLVYPINPRLPTLVSSRLVHHCQCGVI